MDTDQKVKIRTAHVNDSEQILEMQKQVVAEGEFLTTVIEELSHRTIEQQQAWVRKVLENERETFIVAEIKGVIVGWIVFQSEGRKRLAHKGSIGMMVSQEFRGIGIGKQLLKALIEWAEEHPLIEKVCLGVFSNNARALSLYKSMGFKEEGRKIKEFKLGDEEYIDDILMYRFV
ncbi:GNAT family N-acetyltransferase [Bacillus niameyensis]|uniref:GNAT family N-acetyltransferase n=1 Tax=Bacillus niameyensis TaxID=1522308 RepID=UPI00078557DC|nr:GNAT family N-acetyltransferase [Bacillus niameyensis]